MPINSLRASALRRLRSPYSIVTPAPPRLSASPKLSIFAYDAARTGFQDIQVVSAMVLKSAIVLIYDQVLVESRGSMHLVCTLYLDISQEC